MSLINNLNEKGENKMLTESIEKMVQDEVESRVNEIKEKYSAAIVDRDYYRAELIEAEQKNRYLENKVDNDLKMSVIFENVTASNFEEFISTLGFKKEDVKFDGMDTDRLPIWFKVVNTYYNDKETIFTLMDMFKIEYPSWAKTYINPQNYGEEELDMIFDNLFNMYVCNGRLFSENMGFFFGTVNRHKANVLEFQQYYDIPWNLFLQNNLLTTDKYFNKIINAIQSKESNSENFYRIGKYQGISDDQIELLLNTLPSKDLKSYHVNFLGMYDKVFTTRPDLAENFKDKMESFGGAFHYKKFPINYQIDFIKHKVSDLPRKIEMAKGLDLDKKEKIRIINEMLEDDIK